MRRLPVLLAVAVLAAACASPARPSAGSPTASPTAESGATLTPSLIPSASVGSAVTPVAPTSVAPTAAALTCATSQLKISLFKGGGGLGTVGGWLRFVNASAASCELQGWPTLVGVTRTGATTAAGQTNAELDFPLETGAPSIRLALGDAAFAAFAGSDTPGASGTCPASYRSLRVAPPGATKSVSLSGWIAWYNDYLPACAGISVTMLVPASDVPYLEPSPTSQG